LKRQHILTRGDVSCKVIYRFAINFYLHCRRFTWRTNEAEEEQRWSVSRLNYEGVSKSIRTESITKYTLTTINTRLEAAQRAMAVKLTKLTLRIAIQLHLVAGSCAICSCLSRRSVRKLLDTPS
jgi:hypothetical protein